MLPQQVARKVVSDLVRLDYVESLVTVQNSQIKTLEETLHLKDRELAAVNAKYKALSQIRSIQDDNLTNIQEQLWNTEGKVKVLKLQRNIVGGGGLALLLILLIAI